LAEDTDLVQELVIFTAITRGRYKGLFHCLNFVLANVEIVFSTIQVIFAVIEMTFSDVELIISRVEVIFGVV